MSSKQHQRLNASDINESSGQVGSKVNKQLTIYVAPTAAPKQLSCNQTNSTASTMINGQSTKPNENPSESKTNCSDNRAKTKLVFGLNSRTNRLRHDEYAEKRNSSQSQSQSPTQPQFQSLSPVSPKHPLSTKQQQQQSIGGFESSDVEEVLNRHQTSSRTVSSCRTTTTGPTITSKVSSIQSTPAGIGRALRSKESKGSGVETETQTMTDESQHISSSKSPQRKISNSTVRKQHEHNIGQQISIDHQHTSIQKFPLDHQSTISNKHDYDNSSILKPQDNQIMKQDDKKMFDENKTPSEPKAVAVAVTTREPVAPVRMQFTIPPPPPSKISGNKSSLVSYAKSRIYDKPSSGTKPLFAGIVGQQDRLPDAIVSGFKPPKQVNVSKARERWEGGEPFTKCKSRQRLAMAQAGKRRQLNGIWSMTSVVANQQQQLQQALAQSSVARNSNSSSASESPVKVVSRGSVLERVQQFEKAPDDTELEAVIDLNYDYGCETWASTNDPQSASSIRRDSQMPQLSFHSQTSHNSQIPKDSKAGGHSSQLICNNQASSKDNSSPVTSPRGIEQRRFSFRRRSSLSTGSNSSFYIPKFYHPNGKPNTYEIELQKKNIVACFDKFPNRKASLVGPTNRRHFHSIALACGFSEYFKEPLYLYVKSNESLWSQASSVSNPRKQSLERRPSFAGLATSKTQNNADADKMSSSTNQRKPSSKTSLTRSMSTDGSNRLNANNCQQLPPNDTNNNTTTQASQITCDQYLACWRHLIETAFDNVSRFIHLLTFGQRNYLLADDFVPLIQSIIEDHPGLKFLRAAPDFHMRYIQTVIARIYFSINKSWTGKISQNELRQSNFMSVLEQLSQIEDINKINDYFSYEHFYVIYCKFWSLDQDHDLLISKEDLARHNDASISSRIIERIFMGIVSRHIQETGKMSYTDFVWFLIAEEDKKHPRSIEYWFRLMDIDGDGYISMYEMEYFYYEQVKRLELMNIEALPFLDCACQILDLVNPKEKNKISLSDLKRTKMVTIFFDTFINLEKYLEHESREFVSTRDVIIDGVLISDWDRYASDEYESLVREETSV